MSHPDRPSVPGPAPRQDAWRILGPGGGGTMIGPTVSPHDPRFVLEHCDMTGSYLTTDGGLSWRMINFGGVINVFAYDPADPRVIYAGSHALWRSDDRGRTWRMILPDPARTVAYLVGDHADCHLSSDDPAFPGSQWRITGISVDPGDPARVFCTWSGPGTLVMVSPDRGETWTRLPELPRGRVLALSVHGGALYLVANQGVRVFQEGEWRDLPGPEGREIAAAAIGAAPGAATPTIYATTPTEWQGEALAGGIFVSEDGGRSWRNCSQWVTQLFRRPGEGPSPGFRAIACCAQEPRVCYVGFRRLRLEEAASAAHEERVSSAGVWDGNFPGWYNGIARTRDGGHTWHIVHKESTAPSDNMETSWIEERAPDGGWNIWFDDPVSLGVAPTDPEVCYATDLFRTYRTQNGGQTWEQVNSVRVGDRGWTTRGLDVTTCYGVHFDPHDLNHMFITYTDIGLFQSTDGGRSWVSSTEGIPMEWRNTTYWIEFDPAVPGLVWGAFAGPHDLPRPKMWRGRDVAGYTGGVAVSTDGGLTWRLSNRGMPETAATHILLEPTSPVGSRTLYVCGFGRGVFKSTDNGQTWCLKNCGIAGEQPFAWRLVRAADGTLYLIVARRSDQGEIGDENDGALYRSTDGAESWVRLPLPEGCNGPNGLAIDPRDERRLYLAAWGRLAHPHDIGGGLYLSEDGGQTWRVLFDQCQHLYDVTLDPRNPDIVYVCGFDQAAYRSTDGGKTWTRLRGYNFKWGHRVIPDPVNPDMVYITTFGGSVWHGPACGDPQALEDVITPVPQR